jgi:hypothetical protein
VSAQWERQTLTGRSIIQGLALRDLIAFALRILNSRADKQRITRPCFVSTSPSAPAPALHNNSLLHKKSGGCTKTRGIKYRNSAYLPGLFFGFSARRFCVAVIFFFLTGRFGPLFIAASTERSGRLHASLLISAS